MKFDMLIALVIENKLTIVFLKFDFLYTYMNMYTCIHVHVHLHVHVHVCIQTHIRGILLTLMNTCRNF